MRHVEGWVTVTLGVHEEDLAFGCERDDRFKTRVFYFYSKRLSVQYWWEPDAVACVNVLAPRSYCGCAAGFLGVLVSSVCACCALGCFSKLWWFLLRLLLVHSGAVCIASSVCHCIKCHKTRTRQGLFIPTWCEWTAAVCWLLGRFHCFQRHERINAVIGAFSSVKWMQLRFGNSKYGFELVSIVR